MVDHLIFNKLKWFNVADNADQVSANGRNYVAIPKQVTIPSGTSVWGDYEMRSYDYLINTDTTCNIVGKTQFMWAGNTSPKTVDCYVTLDKITGAGNDNMTYFIPVSSVKNVKWGGNSPLSRLYQAFKLLLCSKEVLRCI